MSAGIYSQLKAAHHRDRLDVLREGRPVVPVHLQVVLSDLCNHACSWCAYRSPTGLSSELFPDDQGRVNPHRMIPTEKALEIVHDAAKLGVRAIQFTGGGEPTVHPDHLQVFGLAQDLGIETALVTNGVKLTPDHDAILRMSWIRVSVDAGDAETYAKIRQCPPAHFAKVWQNVERLARSYTGTLGVGFVVAPDSYRGILSAALMAKAAGVSNMRVGAVFSTEGTRYYGDLLPQIIETIAEAKVAVDGDGFELVDLFGRRIGDLEEGRPTDAQCSYQHLTWYIGGDLHVARCCNTAYTKAGVVGSLKDRRLIDIMGEHEPFDARGCRYCQFLGINRGINALLERPAHANFV